MKDQYESISYHEKMKPVLEKVVQLTSTRWREDYSDIIKIETKNGFAYCKVNTRDYDFNTCVRFFVVLGRVSEIIGQNFENLSKIDIIKLQ